jgi:hypothetical protein
MPSPITNSAGSTVRQVAAVGLQPPQVQQPGAARQLPGGDDEPWADRGQQPGTTTVELVRMPATNVRNAGAIVPVDGGTSASTGQPQV